MQERERIAQAVNEAVALRMRQSDGSDYTIAFNNGLEAARVVAEQAILARPSAPEGGGGVTQADREAAADWLATDDDAEDMQHFAQFIRGGHEDDHSLVQAFARHRRQAVAEVREECARIADMHDHKGDIGKAIRRHRSPAAIRSGACEQTTGGSDAGA